MLIDQFKEEIDAYLAKTGMSKSAFGIAAISDNRFVFRLEEGADVKASTIDAVREFMTQGPP